MSEVSARGRRRLKRERERLETEAEETSEVNLIPYLDIVTNILLFLLVTVTSTLVLGNIEVIVPQYAQASTGGGQKDQVQLNLTVVITHKGFTVAGSDATLGILYQGGVKGKLPTIPKVDDKYDFAKLQELIAKIKKSYPDENQAILTANPDIQYENVIGVMDVLRAGPNREPLFPLVRFSTGIQ
jgi:biopolymer transport protein ExbD